MRPHRSAGSLFKKKYLNALVQSAVHAEQLSLLNKNVPDDVLHTWTTMITEWENNRTKPNPNLYYTPLEGKWTIHCLHD